MCSALVARKSRDDIQSDAPPYALGYSDDEFGRLERQGGYYRDLTEDVLVRAGIGEGMRVLDVGCGVGDVSLIAGRLVGPTGSVLGVDRSPEAIETAGRRVEEDGQGGFVRFTSAELDTYRPAARFDAVIGRFILMYLPDPAAALRRFAACLEPGGVVVFHEMAMAQARSLPEGPLFQQCLRWITETFVRTGFEIDMGGKLYRTFLATGLPAPPMIAAARVEAGPDAFAYDYLAQTLRSLLPIAERTGVATRAEIEVDSLAARLRGEALQTSACIKLPTLIGAWSTTPGVSKHGETCHDRDANGKAPAGVIDNAINQRVDRIVNPAAGFSVREGTQRFMNGDTAPWLGNASRGDDVMIMGAWGGHEKGWPAVEARYQWAGARFRDSGAELAVEYLTAFESGDLAVTTAIERAQVRVEGLETTAAMTLRVTHVFRKE